MLDALLWVLTREEIQAVHVFSQTRCFVFRFLIRGARCSHETQEKVISKIQTLFSREWGHPGNWLFGHSDEMEEIIPYAGSGSVCWPWPGNTGRRWEKKDVPRQASKNRPSQSLCVEGKAPTAEVSQPAPARGLRQEVR